jgi:hypothetical protein
MAFCTECGANVADGVQFCTECGKPMSGGDPAPATAAPVIEAVHTETATATAVITPPQTASAQAAPIFTGEQVAPAPPYGSPYAVMGVGGYVGASILMSIPIIGWLVCIVWACGGCKNHNKRNYARAFLIFLIIGAVVGVAVYFLLNWLIGGVTEVMQQYLNEAGLDTSGGLGGIQGLLDALKQLGEQVPAQ